MNFITRQLCIVTKNITFRNIQSKIYNKIKFKIQVDVSAYPLSGVVFIFLEILFLS